MARGEDLTTLRVIIVGLKDCVVLLDLMWPVERS